MKLLGRDIPARELISRIEERLRTRGLPTSEPLEVPPEGVEPRVEPLTFNLHALEENADATRALPLHTHRGGAGQLVLVAKWAFRKSCQVFINEALGRQRVFNGHVRDSYAQLSAEVIRLRREVEELRARGGGGGRPPGDERPVPAVAPPAAKASLEVQARAEREPPAKPTGPTERAPRTVEAAAGKPAPAPAARATRPRQDASSKPVRPEAAAPSMKASPRAKSTPAPKSPPDTRARPTPSESQVLPQPRHARDAATQPPRSQAGAPRTRPETPGPSTQPAGQRPRKSGDKRRGRRK
jgi:hypothetical protein